MTAHWEFEQTLNYLATTPNTVFLGNKKLSFILLITVKYSSVTLWGLVSSSSSFFFFFLGLEGFQDTVESNMDAD